jgi:hypothetical protein
LVVNIKYISETYLTFIYESTDLSIELGDSINWLFSQWGHHGYEPKASGTASSSLPHNSRIINLAVLAEELWQLMAVHLAWQPT